MIFVIMTIISSGIDHAAEFQSARIGWQVAHGLEELALGADKVLFPEGRNPAFERRILGHKVDRQ